MAISFDKNEVHVKQGVCVQYDHMIFNYISEKDPIDGWLGALTSRITLSLTPNIYQIIN